MKRYIVTESQLNALFNAAVCWATNGGSSPDDTGYQDCKLIEVPEGTTHFALFDDSFPHPEPGDMIDCCTVLRKIPE